MEEYSICPDCDAEVLDRQNNCPECQTDFQVFNSNEYDIVRYYTILEVTVVLNLLYAVFCIPISAYLINIHFIGFISLFLPTVIAVSIISYVITGIVYRLWIRGPKINLLIFGSMLAIMIHIGIVLWVMVFFRVVL